MMTNLIIYRDLKHKYNFKIHRDLLHKIKAP